MALKLVSEKTAKEVAVQRAAALCNGPLRELTANILRVVRGSGRPNDIGRHARKLVQALDAYYEVTGYFDCPDNFPSEIDISSSGACLTGMDSDAIEEELALEAIKKGVLQMVASKMLYQPTQVAAGRKEMYEGVWRLEGAHANRRKRHQLAWEAENPEPPKTRKAPKPKPRQPKSV